MYSLSWFYILPRWKMCLKMFYSSISRYSQMVCCRIKVFNLLLKTWIESRSLLWLCVLVVRIQTLIFQGCVPCCAVSNTLKLNLHQILRCIHPIKGLILENQNNLHQPLETELIFNTCHEWFKGFATYIFECWMHTVWSFWHSGPWLD